MYFLVKESCADLT